MALVHRATTQHHKQNLHKDRLLLTATDVHQHATQNDPLLAETTTHLTPAVIHYDQKIISNNPLRPKRPTTTHQKIKNKIRKILQQPNTIHNHTEISYNKQLPPKSHKVLIPSITTQKNPTTIHNDGLPPRNLLQQTTTTSISKRQTTTQKNRTNTYYHLKKIIQRLIITSFYSEKFSKRSIANHYHPENVHSNILGGTITHYHP